jgi:ABC-type glycerol-3-phosphate transport system permease component
MLILIIILAILLPYFTVLCIVFKPRFEWTKSRELLLWYTEFEEDCWYAHRPIRKFITLFKL